MEIKPLYSYKTPAYPDKYIVLRNPNILKALPQRWKGNAKIGIALSSIIMLMLAGCGEKTAGYGELTVKDGDKEGARIKQTSDIGLVAPIFRHGEGRGSFGCVSVAPPAFLSEAEAYEIISEEVKSAGIVVDKGSLVLDKVNIPLTSLNYDSHENASVELKSKMGSLELDGYDDNKKIAYEFISRDDIIAWEGQGSSSSVESYDALGTAERLGEGLEGRAGGNTVALFYDPMGFDEEIHDKYNEEFREISRNEKLSDDDKNKKWMEINRKYENEVREIKKTLLREQVRDFLDWLKAQGVI